MSELMIDRNGARAYAAASGDDNPIHIDDMAAQRIGLDGAIAHGMWTFGAALRALSDAGVDLADVTQTSCKFGRPVPLPAHGATTLVATAARKAPGIWAIEVHLGSERVAKIEARTKGTL